MFRWLHAHAISVLFCSSTFRCYQGHDLCSAVVGQKDPVIWSTKVSSQALLRPCSERPSPYTRTICCIAPRKVAQIQLCLNDKFHCRARRTWLSSIPVIALYHLRPWAPAISESLSQELRSKSMERRTTAKCAHHLIIAPRFGSLVCITCTALLLRAGG